jgi:hypothetical protein
MSGVGGLGGGMPTGTAEPDSGLCVGDEDEPAGQLDRSNTGSRGGRWAHRLAGWPAPTERSRHWTVRYALLAYVISWVAANVLLLLLSIFAPLHVGMEVLVVDAMLLAALVLCGAQADWRPG